MYITLESPKRKLGLFDFGNKRSLPTIIEKIGTPMPQKKIKAINI